MRGPLGCNSSRERKAHMQWFRLPMLLAVLVIACADPAGPGTAGPPLFNARVDGKGWTPDNGVNTEAYLTPEGDFLLRAIRRDTLFRAVDGIAVIARNIRGPGRYALTSDWDRDYGLYATYDPVNSTHTLSYPRHPTVGSSWSLRSTLRTVASPGGSPSKLSKSTG